MEKQRIWTDDEIEHEQGKSYMLGRLSGVEEASGFVRERATAAFADKDDDRAHLLRDLADDLLTESKNRRAEWDEQYRDSDL